MNILIANDSAGAHIFDRIAWVKVFQACGHNCVLWQIRERPAFDVFNEVNPDIFVGQLHALDRATVKCIMNRPQMKVILKAGHWGDIDKEIDTTKYPVLVATDEHKKLAQTLKTSVNKPDFVFVHYHPNQIERTMGSWKNLGIKAIGLPNALDTFSYLGGEEKEEFKSDLAIISGYWPYKAQNLDKFILPLCHPVGKYNIKIFGNAHRPVGQDLGSRAEENSKHVFRSAKVNIDAHEPHGPDFGFDVTERIFKVMGAGGVYCSGGYVESTHKDFFPKLDIRYGRSLQEFEIRLLELINMSPEERQSMISANLISILGEHTYFDRVAYALEELELFEEADKVHFHKMEVLYLNEAN